MKIIVSSKSMASKLAEIQFDQGNCVDYITSTSDSIVMHVGAKSIVVFCHFLEHKNVPIIQRGRRWDFVYDVLIATEDQPVVIEIYEKIVNVIFQY